MAFSWIAFFNDSVITQYTDAGETLFQEVLNREESLKAFQLTSALRSVFVNLEEGTFIVDGLRFSFDKLSFLKVPYRIIFFRRVRRDFGWSNLSGQTTVTYNVGFQTTIDGKNYQRVLAISETGNQMSFFEKGSFDS